MEQHNLSLFETVINNFTAIRSQGILDRRIITYDTFEQFSISRQGLQKRHAIESIGLSEAFKRINEHSEEQNALLSGDLNVFRMFGVGETMHSHILANFLNPFADHGQKQLFLNIFLDLINIKRYTDHENWIVTAEKGRVDILLKRVHPHAVVIIENKSNHASDQPNQLYRYWHQEIYSKIGNRYMSPKHIFALPEDHYQLIYLSPVHTKIPSDDSLRKPIGWSEELPDVVPMEPRFLLFNDFVVRWLNTSLEQVPKSNYRLIEYIKQYLELWS